MGFQAADPQTVDAGTTDATTTGSAATVGPRGLHPAGSGRTAPRRTTVPAAAPAPVLPAAGTSRIVVCELISADGGRDIDLTDRTERVTVGRVDTDVVLDDGRVSYRHAELVPAAGGQWLLDDTDSLNGTWVNGRRVERASLVHGDEVRFAGSGPRFLFSRLAGAGR
jgi:pSer/pThr/pTyr-binding forkhead associated (FHA) protein